MADYWKDREKHPAVPTVHLSVRYLETKDISKSVEIRYEGTFLLMLRIKDLESTEIESEVIGTQAENLLQGGKEILELPVSREPLSGIDEQVRLRHKL